MWILRDSIYFCSLSCLSLLELLRPCTAGQVQLAARIQLQRHSFELEEIAEQRHLFSKIRGELWMIHDNSCGERMCKSWGFSTIQPSQEVTQTGPPAGYILYF